MRIRHALTLDLQQCADAPVVHVKQGDCLTRELLIHLTDNASPWNPPEGTIYQVTFCKMDRCGGCYDHLPDGTLACCEEEVGLVLRLHPQMLTVPGPVICELRMLNEEGAQLSTFSFFLDVEPAATFGIASEDYYRFTSLDQLRTAIGDPADLQTEEKSSLVAALNELKRSYLPNEILLYSSQTLNDAQQAQARENISASPATHTHNYRDLQERPIIPTSLPANGGNADTVGGKTAAEIQAAAASAVPATVRLALEEAKASGEFAGKDGKTPEKGVDYFTETDKEEFLQGMGVFEEVGRTYVSNNLCDGAYEWGSLESDGSEGYLSPGYGFRTTNFLPVEGGRKVMLNMDLTTTGTQDRLYCMCEYDAGRNFVLYTRSIERSLNKWDTDKGITLQENTKYVRFYIYNGSHAVELNAIKINLFYAQNIEDFFASPGNVFQYVPHIVVESVGQFVPLSKMQSPLTGKKIVYDGDSICIGTHGGGGYAKIIADRFGGSFVNQAVGGGRLRTLAGSSDSFHSVVDNLENLPTDGDLYCFEGGVNDFWTHGVLGTYELNDFTGALDETTVCGALEAIFRYALNTFVGKPICFIITHKIQSTAYGKNPEGNTFKEYRDAMVGICEKYSIPYYDAFSESGLNGWNTVQNNAFLTGNSNGTPDGCHPNEEGYKRYYVPQLISLFERMMPVE